MSETVIGALSAHDNTTSTTTRTRKDRAAHAAERIAELTEQRLGLVLPGEGATAQERVAHWERRALLTAQLGRWWRVLGVNSIAEVPEVFIDAALGQWQTERVRARSDRDRARTWAEIHTRRSIETAEMSR
jgi:hypothetical protein